MDTKSQLPLTSSQPSGLSEICHGSAAGTPGTPEQLQLEATTAAAPAAKRDRRSPAPHPVVIPQAIADGADISLEMSSDGDSPLGAATDGTTPRSSALPPRPAPGVVKTIAVVKARSASTGARGLGMKIKRGVSPSPRRSALPAHQLVQEWRAEGA